MMEKYFKTLPDSDCETLFVFMRTLDKEIDRYLAEHQRLSPPYGQIAIGAAHFDPWLQAAVSQNYLSALREGKTPEEAEQSAIEHGQLCVKKHNEKRPKDIIWTRDRDFGQAVAERLRRQTPCHERVD